MLLHEADDLPNLLLLLLVLLVFVLLLQACGAARWLCCSTGQHVAALWLLLWMSEGLREVEACMLLACLHSAIGSLSSATCLLALCYWLSLISNQNIKCVLVVCSPSLSLCEMRNCLHHLHTNSRSLARFRLKKMLPAIGRWGGTSEAH